ncbi:MAG: L,D-transpeptidase family protein [Phycisphaerales bacterium]
MPLPSQTARLSAARSPMFRKRHRSAKPWALGGVVGVGVIGTWWLLGGGGSGPGTGGIEGAPLSSTSTERSSPGEPSPATITGAARVQPPPAAPAEAVYPPPTVIDMGARRSAEKTEPKQEPAPVAPPKNEPTLPIAGDPRRTPDPVPHSPEIQSPAGTLPRSASGLPADLENLLTAGRRGVQQNNLVAARQHLSRAFIDPRLPESERTALREELTKLNDELVFSPRPIKDDPFVLTHTVQSGDIGLERIARKNGVSTHWRLIQRVNRLADPNKIRLNQKLKLVKGPFHAIVNKAAFRMDLYLGDPQRPQDWLYVRSLTVGLGEGGSTPIGDYTVRRGSKLENPYWTNPRTGEQFSKDDARNPIGERWIGLEGVGDSAANTGYGIHGTIDPGSIGKEMSMGCVRLGADDVALVYELLGEGVSIVRIVP